MEIKVGDVVIWESKQGPVSVEYRGKVGAKACVIVRPGQGCPCQMMVPFAELRGSDAPVPRTIKLPEKDWSDDSPSGGEGLPCVICGKAIRKPEFEVHLVDGGGSLCHPEDQWPDDSSDLYWYPIGRCCLRKHPQLKPFAVKNKK